MVSSVILSKNQIHCFKVRFNKLWHVDHFLAWGFFKFITTKEPNSGNYKHIFSRKDCSEKMYAYNSMYEIIQFVLVLVFRNIINNYVRLLAHRIRYSWLGLFHCMVSLILPLILWELLFKKVSWTCSFNHSNKVLPDFRLSSPCSIQVASSFTLSTQ